jgi:hypothetical protein
VEVSGLVSDNLEKKISFKLSGKAVKLLSNCHNSAGGHFKNEADFKTKI